MLLFSSFDFSHRLAMQIIVPFFSIILLYAGWSAETIGYFFAAFTLGFFLFSPVIGKLSDIIGRKKLILTGLIGQIIFLLLYFNFTQNVPLIVGVRFFDGVITACVMVVTLGAFEDSIKEKRGFWTGLFLSIGTIATMIGPIIAGIISEKYSTDLLFTISMIIIITSIFILIVLPEKKRIKKETIVLKDFNPLSEIQHFFTKKKLRGMGLIGMIANARGQTYLIFFPLLIVEVMGYSERVLGFLLAIPVSIHIFQFYFGRVADKISAEFGILGGVFTFSFVFLFLPYVSSIFWIVLILFVAGIGGAYFNVNAWSLMGRIAKEENIEGEIIGTYYSIANLGMFISALIGAGLVSMIGIAHTLQIYSILLILSICVSYFYFEPIFHHERKKSIFHKIVAQHTEDKD